MPIRNPQAGCNQILLGQGRPRELGADNAVMDYQHPVTQANQFFVIAAVEQDRFPFTAQLSE
jgi:hypothetical protein